MPLDLSQAAYRSTEELGVEAAQHGLPVSGMGTLGSVVEQLRPVPTYRGDVSALAADVRVALAAGLPVVITMGATGPAQRLAEQLTAFDVPARLSSEGTLDPVVHIVKARLQHGLRLDALVLLTERDITGASSATVNKMPSKRRKALDPLTLKPGDFVVHQQHGVGRYVEMTQRTVAGAVREYLVRRVRSQQAGAARRPSLRSD